jgi:hypothetical protein
MLLEPSVPSRIIALALLGLMSVALAGGGWTVAQWQTLFNQVPAPPPTLAQAGSRVGLVTNKSNNVDLELTDPVLLRSRAAYHAGIDAINQTVVQKATSAAGVGDIDIARLRSDPAYAQQLQQKLTSMSQAEKIQMAMQMQASQQQSQQAMLANPAGLRAGGALVSYAVGGPGGQQLRTAGTGLRTDFTRLVKDYDARHTALGQKLATALKACPVLPFSVCHSECGPDLKCLAGINAQVPDLIAQHRKLAAAELADERALLARTRAAMQPVIAKATQLTTAAEGAGTASNQLQAGYTLLATATSYLQIYTALATLRAGYWQNIQQRTVPDDYNAATSDIGYQYPLGKDDSLSEPPTDLPKGW